MIPWLLACAGAPELPAAAPGAPDIVLLVVRKWRADPPGRARAEAALLEAFDPPSVRFDNAYSQSPLAFPSLASLFLGTYPSAAPVCDLGRGATDAAARPWCGELPEDRASLPEVLAAYGYRTALFTSGLPGADALERGFASQHHLGSASTDWAELQEETVSWWERGGPRFLAVVVSDLDLASRDDLLQAAGYGDRPHDEARQHLKRAYLSEAAAVGERLASLRAALEGAEIVALTASEGLSIGETRDDTEPGFFKPHLVVDLQVHVPLVIWDGTPGPRTVEAPVELIDLAPTLLSRAGAVLPADIAGRSLDEPPDGWAYAELGDQLALREGRWLLTWRPYRHHASALDPALTRLLDDQRPGAENLRLHDVSADPHQHHELAHARVDELARLLERLRAVRHGEAAPAPTAHSAEHLLELRLARSDGYW